MPYAYRRNGVTLSPETLALKHLNARTSPLLRLPGELRNRIYALALSSDTTLRLRAVHPPSAIYAFVPMATPVLRLIDEKKHFLALLSVCRQVQEEAYMVVFKENAFEEVERKRVTVWVGKPVEFRYNLVGQPSKGFPDRRRYLNIGMYLGPAELEEAEEIKEERENEE